MAIPELDESAPLRPRRERTRPGLRRGLTIALGSLLVLSVGSVGVWMLGNQQRVADQFTVWQFEVDDTIHAYAERSAMTDEGRFLFYASRPEVKGQGAFDAYCSSDAEEVGVLGCYLHESKRIYLYDVTDDRLDGLEEVVAAHEMLHAAWDRMSQDERDALTPLLEAEAAKRADDPEFAKTLAYYAKSEPGQRLNELHSIIGTEFDSLSPELEAHYAIYLSDRASLVALHEKSNAVFLAQQEAIAAIVAQLESLKAETDADYAAYNAGYDELNSDIAAFNARADSGDFVSQRQFFAERDDLLSRQGQLDTLYASIEQRAAQYDELVAQLDDLNAQVTELNQSINIAPRSDTGLGG